VPELVKRAQCQLAIDAATYDLMPTGAGREVVREKVDVIETEYAQRGSASVTPLFHKALSFLCPLFRNSSGRLRVVRV
jgi:hypothetical protein